MICIVSMYETPVQYVTVRWGWDPPTVGDGKYTDNSQSGLEELIH